MTSYPIIQLTSGQQRKVKGVDESKAPAIARDFKTADSPERAISIVTEAIALRVPLWDGLIWFAANPAHVVIVMCDSYDG